LSNTLEPLAAQEIMERVSLHLITQGEPAKNYDGDCVYRDDHGRKCAVGCLIPDDRYDPEMDREGTALSTAIDSIKDMFPVFEELGFHDHIDLLEDLQRVHDVSDPDEWLEQLEAVATKYGLRIHPDIANEKE
jgi:hypothetical protein